MQVPSAHDTQFLALSEHHAVIEILDHLLLENGTPNRPGYKVEPEGRSINWHAVSKRLSSTESAALFITRHTMSLIANGGLPAGHQLYGRLSPLLFQLGL